MKRTVSILGILTLGLMISSATFGEGVPEARSNSAVSGKVVDLGSGETLAGVAVSIEGTDLKVYTDLDGNFLIEDVNPGVYNLVISMISYKDSLVENVELLPDEKEVLEVKLDNN